MSKAKARRNSKTKQTASRAKLGLPAKAGKRRPHNIKSDGKGNYVAAEFKPRTREEYTETKGFTIADVPASYVVNIPKGAELREGLDRIRKMERNSKNNSDPFAFQRMRTHFVHGLFDFQKKEAGK